jgi:hypothetical protein
MIFVLYISVGIQNLVRKDMNMRDYPILHLDTN